MPPPSPDGAPAIVVAGVSRFYAAQPALRGVSFGVAPGERVALLGRNGAGKTTLLRILAGVLDPSAGRVQIAGADPSEPDPGWRARLGFLPEQPPLHDDMSVAAYLEYVAELRGADAAAAERVIAQCELGSHAGRRIGTLSHGFRQRVGLAQAIVHQPQVLLLDEPAAGLDPAQTAALRTLLQSLELTLLLSSHLLSEVARIATRYLVLEEGRLVRDFGASDEQEGVRLRVEPASGVPAPHRILVDVVGTTSFEAIDECTFRIATGDRAAVCRALIAAGHELVALERPTSTLSELEAIFGEAAP